MQPQPSTDMTLTRLEQMERFKARFKQDFYEFLQHRADAIGKPTEWKVGTISFTGSSHQIALKKQSPHANNGASNGAPASVTFALHEVPDHLTAQERLALRQFANGYVGHFGFTPYQPRTTPLPSDDIEAIQNGDEAATIKWADKHRKTWRGYAEKSLQSRDTALILDPDDIVNAAIEETLLVDKSEAHPTSKIGRHIMQRAVHRYPVDSKTKPNLYAESKSRKVQETLADRHQPEYDDIVDILAEKLPELIAHAKENCSDEQLNVMAALIENHSNQAAKWQEPGDVGYHTMGHKEIGIQAPKEDGSAKGIERVRQLLDGKTRNERYDPGIRDILLETAQTLGKQDEDYRRIADYISWLITTPKKLGGREI